eukprot:gene25692-33548_t
MFSDSFEIDVTGAEKVSGIRIFVGESSVKFFEVFIESVCTKYGKKHSAGHCGRKEGDEITINFSDVEYVTGIFGSKKSNILTSVGVITNFRKIGPFGVPIGNEFEIDHNLSVAKITATARSDHGVESIIVYCSKLYNPETARFNYFFDTGDYRSAFRHLNSHRKAEVVNEIYRFHISNDVELWSALLFTKVSADISECASLYVALSDYPALQAIQRGKSLEIASCFEADPELRLTLLSKFESAIRKFRILRVKLTHKNVSRRIQFSSGSVGSQSSPDNEDEEFRDDLTTHQRLTYETLCTSISLVFPHIAYSIQYHDDEGDVVTVGSDEELNEAIRIMTGAGVENRTIHFTIVGDTIQPPENLPHLLHSSGLAVEAVEVEVGHDIIVDSHVDETPQAVEKAEDTYLDEDIHTSTELPIEDVITVVPPAEETTAVEPTVEAIAEGSHEDFDSAFVSHCTFNLGGEVQPGSVLCKVWTVRNSGTRAWPLGSAPVLVGDEGTATEYKSVALLQPVEAGEVAQISIYIKAAEEAGPFNRTFRMALPDGPGCFGDELFLQLQVLNAEDDWDVILRNEDEVADSMLHTKSPSYSAAEEDLFPNLTLSTVLRPSSMIQNRDELPQPSEILVPISETSQPMEVDEGVPMESDLEG